MWPVGQAVKTKASHALNVGSIPARVTNKTSKTKHDNGKHRFIYILSTSREEHEEENESFAFFCFLFFLERKRESQAQASPNPSKRSLRGRGGAAEYSRAFRKESEPYGACDDEVGTYYCEGPPVPIPNTVVKLTHAYDTWTAASRENWSAPTQKHHEKNRGAFVIFIVKNQKPLTLMLK